MNKNKKLIKFHRKEVLISNPLNPIQQGVQQQQSQGVQAQNQNYKAPKNKQKSSKQAGQSQLTSLAINASSLALDEKLELPKQMRVENITNLLRSKFISIMDSQPLIKIDSLFQNEIVGKITGNIKNVDKNRQSFDKRHKQKERKIQLIKQQDMKIRGKFNIEYNNYQQQNDYGRGNKKNQPYAYFQQFSNQESNQFQFVNPQKTNYLQLISQAQQEQEGYVSLGSAIQSQYQVHRHYRNKQNMSNYGGHHRQRNKNKNENGAYNQFFSSEPSQQNSNSFGHLPFQ